MKKSGSLLNCDKASAQQKLDSFLNPLGMRPVLKRKPDVEEGDGDYFPDSPRKDFSLGMLKLVSILVIFMAGAVLGLSISASFSRYHPWHYASHTDHFFPRTASALTATTTLGCGDCSSGIRHFINPMTLEHTMTDEQLFWRASMVPKREDAPYKRVPKVAFLFLTRGPLPLAPLWERFFQGHRDYFSIYVHALPGYELNVSMNSVFYGRQIPSQEVEWGTISLVDAERRLLANALLDFSNERFVLLSESCIPLFNFPNVYSYLMNSPHSFIESYDLDISTARGRYNSAMAPEVTLEDWRKGSEWFEMSREVAVNVVGDTKYYNIFKHHCKPNYKSCYSDEHYIPTYVSMFHGGLNANRTLTWVDWSRGGPHPASFGSGDVTAEFIESIRNTEGSCMYDDRRTTVCYLFARKFTPSALEPLLNISSTVMRY